MRVVSLGDFLSYIGYKSQRRLFVPGSDVPYKLKSGSRSAAVDETTGTHKSSGTTSEAYTNSSNKKSAKPKTFSGGNTSGSGVFRK